MFFESRNAQWWMKPSSHSKEAGGEGRTAAQPLLPCPWVVLKRQHPLTVQPSIMFIKRMFQESSPYLCVPVSQMRRHTLFTLLKAHMQNTQCLLFFSIAFFTYLFILY